MDRRKATAKLFEMVERSQTDNIHKFLDRGANINARDKDGNTPLIIAARNRNYVLQDLLLSRGADVRKRDKSGRTALHHEAWAGDLECVNLLLAHGAEVDAQDSEGRTPLMFAVNSGHFKVADILVFCGADGTIKAKDGKSPASICKSGDFKALMRESKQIVEGIKNKLVKIQQKVLRPQEGSEETEIDLPEMGLHLRVNSQSLGRGVGLLMRRVPPELSRSSLAPGEKELLLSDTFEYRLARSTIDGAAIVTIPIFSAPTVFESAFIKTDVLPEVDETIIDPISHFDIENQGDLHEEKVSCTTEIDLGSITAFLLVTQIRVEHFPMTSKGGLLTSEIDETVQINVPENCFSDQGDITLEIIPRPMIKPDEFQHLVAISHFYDVKHTEKEQPKQGLPVTLHLPLPRTYRGSGKFVALLRRTPPDLSDDDDDDDDNEDFEKELSLWDLVDDNPSRDARRANFDLPHFSSGCIMEAKIGTSDSEIRTTAARVYRKAQLRERQVSFDAFLRQAKSESDKGSNLFSELEGTDENLVFRYDVVVACSEIKQLHRTKDFFQNEGYRYLPQSHPDGTERTVVPRQPFSIELGGGNLEKKDNSHRQMQFHPKREHQNRVQMILEPKREEEYLVGWMLVKQDKVKDVRLQRLANEDFEDVTLEINVERDFVQEDNRFMNDKFMKWLADEVRKDFKRLGKYLGLSEGTIQRIDVNKKSELVFKMLRLWRGKCQSRLDLGLPGLLYALGRTEKKKVQKEVVKRLKAWLQQDKAEDPSFKVWAQAEVAKPDYDPAKDVGRPMSDDYLTWVACEMGERPHIRDLAPSLDIPTNQVEYIEQDPFTKGKLWQILKLLKTSRDRHDSHVTAFAALMELLHRRPFEEIRNEAIRKAKNWSDSMTSTADLFAHQLESLLQDDLYEVPEPQTEDTEDVVSRPVSRTAGTPRPSGAAGTPRRQGPDRLPHSRGAKKNNKDVSKRSRTSSSSSISSKKSTSEDSKKGGDRKDKKHEKEKPSSGSERDSSPSSSSIASKQDYEKPLTDRSRSQSSNKSSRSSSRNRSRNRSRSRSSSNNSSSRKSKADDKKKKGEEDGKISEDQQSLNSHTSTDAPSTHEKEKQKEDDYSKSVPEDMPRRGSHSSSRASSSRSSRLSAGGKGNDGNLDQASVSSKGKLSSAPPSDEGNSTKEGKDDDRPVSARSRTSVDSDSGSRGSQGKSSARTHSQTSSNSKRGQEFPNERMFSEDGEVEYLPVDTPGSSESTEDSNKAKHEEETLDNNVFEEEKAVGEEQGEKRSVASERSFSRQGSRSTIDSRGERSNDSSNRENADPKNVAA